MSTTNQSFDGQLAEKKEAFLSELKDGKDLKDWILVMGNEAGDLDSLASSIAYSTFATSSSSPSSSRYIPLQLTPRSDLYLRPENLESLRLSSISPSSLLTIDDIPSPISQSLKSTRFVLVDHNSLLPMFRLYPQDHSKKEDDERVIGVIDHHADESLHLSAKPRLIELVGSCSSLVTTHFLSSFSSTWSPNSNSTKSIDKGLADLLIAALLIDTRLKPLSEGGKATPTDLSSLSLLLPHSSFSRSVSSSSSDDGISTLSQETLDSLTERSKHFGKLKEDVSWMNGRDLLRRDYKEYLDFPSLPYGLATVPLGLNIWLDKFNEGQEVEGVLRDFRSYMKERQLRLLGVLTSYNHIKKKTGEIGKHRRELWIVSNDSRLNEKGGMFEALEEDGTLELGEWKEAKNYGGVYQGEGDEGGERWRVWQQGNTRATRKQVAPILKGIVEEATKEKEKEGKGASL